MKSKNIAIAVVILILLLLLGLAGYKMLGKNSSTPTKTTTATQTAPKTEKTTKSLLDLIQMGKNLRCTFKSEVSNGSTEGTVYVSGQNIRSDFSITTSDGKKMQTSMIKGGDTSYIWGAGLPTGIKMKISLDKLAQNKQASQYIDPNQKINYSCTPWNVDKSLFTTPADVKFTDMTNLLTPKTTDAVTGTPTTTNPCNQITDSAAKAACESALQKSGQ